MKHVSAVDVSIVVPAFDEARSIRVTLQELSAWLDDGVIIDTRTTLEYSAGHIENSVLLPYDTIRQTISQVAPDKATPIILYCRSGNRAGKTAAKMASQVTFRPIWSAPTSSARTRVAP